MKQTYPITAAIVLAGVLSATAADYFQDFNSIGINGTTPPTGWTERYVVGTSLDTVAPTSSEIGTTTAGIATMSIWNQTDAATEWQNQLANVGATAASTDRALGTSPTGTRGTVVQFVLPNTFGKPITTVSLSYDVELLAAGVLKDGFAVGAEQELLGYSFYFLDGSTWTPVPALDRSTPGTASGTFTFTTPLAINTGNIQFRWFDDNAYAYSPDQMYAIDNVSVTIPEPTTLTLLALGGLALVSFRRKA
jgi:hypothetical protein